jgi:DNA-binding transcriptional LysR family regulator
MTSRLQSWDNRIGRRLKLRDLHILSVVVEWGSMAKAATQLAMSQPAVSESIASLEAALGVRLLDRSARGVEPTRYAHALLKRGNVVFDELMQGVKEIEFMANPTTGEVRVASGDTAAASLLAPAIDAMSRRYPNIVVHVSQASAEPLEYPELRQRRVDLVLARMSKAFTQNDLDTETLFDDPPRVVVGASSRLARRRNVTLADLVGETWTLTSDQVIHDFIWESFHSKGIPPPKERVVASSMLLRSKLLATGRYVTVLPDSVLRYNAKQWSLKALPIDLGMSTMAVRLVTLKNRAISPVVKLFMDQVRATAKPLGSPGGRPVGIRRSSA